MINIGIVGSRKFKNRGLVVRIVDGLMRSFGSSFTLVSGGCVGSPDQYSEEHFDFMVRMDIFDGVSKPKKKIFLPKTNDKDGYFERNRLIAENSDFLIVFIPRNQVRSGAWNTVKWMRNKKSQNGYVVIDEEGKRWNR